MTDKLAAAPSSDTEASDLIAVLRERAPRLALALAAGQAAWPTLNWARGKVHERRTYTVKIPGNDAAYDDVHAWVLTLIPEHERRALVAYTPSRQSASPVLAGGRKDEVPPLRLRYDGSREHAVNVAGHRVRVCVLEHDQVSRDSGYTRPPEIMFTTTTAEAQRAVLREVKVLAATARQDRRPCLRTLDQWGDWDRRDDLPVRPLESVILADGQMDRIITDIRRFLDAEAEYVRRGIPWHRGYLFHGPPGTGKTSTPQVIAAHLGMDLWHLPLRDVQKDGGLLRLVGRITPRSMLLIEDIDVFSAATERTDDAEVTLSGLLNALDGVATPHGLITVMTSNHPEVLDPAVTRPGRVDLIEEFGLADKYQATDIIAHFYGHPVPPDALGGGALVSPAQVIEACKRHDTALPALDELRVLRAALAV